MVVTREVERAAPPAPRRRGGLRRRRARRERGGGAAHAERGALALWLVIVGVALVWGTLEVRHEDVGLHAAPFKGHWEWHGGWRLLPAAALGAAVAARGPRVAHRLRWPWVVVATGAAAAAWTAALAAGDGWDRLTAPLATRHEYEPFAAGIGDLGGFLSSYVEQLHGRPIHVQGHPPGPVVLAWALDRLHLSGAGWLAAVAIAAWGVAVAAALVTARLVAGEPAARRAAPALAVLPAAIWAGTSLDPVFAALAALAITLATLAALPLATADGTTATAPTINPPTSCTPSPPPAGTPTPATGTEQGARTQATSVAAGGLAVLGPEGLSASARSPSPVDGRLARPASDQAPKACLVAAATATPASAGGHETRRPRPAGDRHRRRMAERSSLGLGAGGVFGLALLSTYGAVPLAVVLAIAVVVAAGGSAPRAATIVVLAGTGALAVLGLAAAAGFWWPDGLEATRAAYWDGLGARRPAGYVTLVGNPAAFGLAVGPAVVAGLGALARAATSPPGGRATRIDSPAQSATTTSGGSGRATEAEQGGGAGRWTGLVLGRRPARAAEAVATAAGDPLPASPAGGSGATRGGVGRAEPAVRLALVVGAAAVAVTVANLSQLSRGEVERIWLPFVPWLALAAPGDRRAWLAVQVAVALALQSFLVSPW